MKSYKNVELFAKNAPMGAYAAGCPTHTHVGSNTARRPDGYQGPCAICEVAA